jgi:hypothetical protein
MANLKKDAEEFDEFFNLSFAFEESRNQRKTVRYIRKDIVAAVAKISLFNVGKIFKVKLHDISTRGVFISTQKKLKLHCKLTVFIIFKDGKKFSISAKIVRQKKLKVNFYGIKFDACNHDLGDYLLETQVDLIFK